MDPTILSFLIVAAYHLLAHTAIGAKVFAALHLPNFLLPTGAGSLKSELLAEVNQAIQAAVQQAMGDIAQGQVSPTKASILAELEDVISAAAKQAVADLRAKFVPATPSK